MKKTTFVVALAALSMALTASVDARQEKIPERQKSSVAGPEGTTITGCVARGTAANTYTLTEEKKNESATAAAGAPAAPLMLAGTDVDLSEHVGHSVEVTGSWANTDAPTGTAGTERPAAADASKKTAKTFTVKSVKMVAATCRTAAK